MGVVNIGVQIDKRSLHMAMDLGEECFTERFIIRHLSRGSLYEPDVAAAMVRMVKPGDVVIDAGANVGMARRRDAVSHAGAFPGEQRS
jgi:hypothetical protein